MLGFNTFQQIFLVAYSILYGVMLQYQSGRKPTDSVVPFQPFPWGQIRRSSVHLVRLPLSILVLNIGPFIYGITVLSLLDMFKGFGYGYAEWQSWLLIFVTLWSGLGVFGFQRLYGLLAWKSPRFFFELRVIMEEQLEGYPFDCNASAISIIWYLLVPTLLLLSLHEGTRMIGGFASAITIVIFVALALD